MKEAKIAPSKYPGAFTKSSKIPRIPTKNHRYGNKYENLILFLIGKYIPL